MAGGDRSDRFWTPEEYSPSPTGFAEYRVEVFSPPFVFDTQHRPTITAFPQTMRFGEAGSDRQAPVHPCGLDTRRLLLRAEA